MFSDVNWAEVFTPTEPLIELFVRGTISYLGLLILIRLAFQRESGTIKITNLLVIVLIADAIQNGMAGSYRSITDGMILGGVIVGWAYALDWLGYRIPAIQRFVHPPPLLLVRDGQMQRRNMRHELITPDELMEMIRQQGLEDLTKVKKAWLEGDGRISVITTDDAHRSQMMDKSKLRG